MQDPIPAAAARLARVGEQSGIGVDAIILLLESGVSMDALLDLIEQGLRVRLRMITRPSQGVC